MIARNSPIRHLAASAAQLRILWGADETREFERQWRDFARAWTAAGNAADVVPEPAKNHFTVLHALEDPHSDASRWIASQLDDARSA